MSAPEQPRRPNDTVAPLPDDESGDFAGEHDDTTLSGQLEGGPEHAPEPESPEGTAGMDD